MIAGYLFHCAIRLNLLIHAIIETLQKSNNNQNLNLAKLVILAKLKFQYKWANHIFPWEQICEAVIIF